MTTWAVTGGAGFIGRRVLERLRDRAAAAGDRLVALGRSDPRLDGVDFGRVDLADRGEVAAAIGRFAPDRVVHAAGRTPPAGPAELYRAHALATEVLLDTIDAAGRHARVVIVGSAAEIGPVEAGRGPIDEASVCRPAGPYGLSKLLATSAGLARRGAAEVVVARVFNPIGPGMPDHLAFGRFASILARAGPGPVEMTVGRLDDRRDFVDVRDVADALIDLADRGPAGRVVHVGSGRSRGVGEGLDALIALRGGPVVVIDGADRDRPATDYAADIRRLRESVGWRPRFDFDASIAAIWAEARGRSVAIDPPGGPS